METGIIDGIWTSVLGWVMSGRDPGKFFTVFPPHAALMYKICSLEWWNGLPEEVRLVIDESMQKALDLNWKIISPEYEKKNLDAFPCGKGEYQACYLTKEEAKIWREKSKAVYEQTAPAFGKKLTDLALDFSKVE
jgi:TRAP-type C4-dicarboxylate transport system substrate-binding protein